jgi:hypothetical protein
VLGKAREQHVSDHESKDRIAEKLERLVVDDAAGSILVGARSVRQGMLEQSEIGKSMPDALLERPKRLAQSPDLDGRSLVEVSGNQVACLLRRGRIDADAELGMAERNERHRRGERGRNKGIDPVSGEQAADDFGLDGRVAAEDFHR